MSSVVPKPTPRGANVPLAKLVDLQSRMPRRWLNDPVAAQAIFNEYGTLAARYGRDPAFNMAIDSDELAPLANLLDHFAAAEGSVASDAMDVEEVSAAMAEPAPSESGVSEAPARPATRGAVAKGKGKAPAPAPRPVKVKVEPGTSRVTKKAVAAKKTAAATTPKKRNTKRRREDSPSPEPMASDIEILPSREATEDPTPVPNGRHDIKLAPHPVGSRLVIHRSGAAYLAESVAPLPKIDVPTMDEIATGRWRPAEGNEACATCIAQWVPCWVPNRPISAGDQKPRSCYRCHTCKGSCGMVADMGYIPTNLSTMEMLSDDFTLGDGQYMVTRAPTSEAQRIARLEAIVMDLVLSRSIHTAALRRNVALDVIVVGFYRALQSAGLISLPADVTAAFASVRSANLPLAVLERLAVATLERGPEAYVAGVAEAARTEAGASSAASSSAGAGPGPSSLPTEAVATPSTTIPAVLPHIPFPLAVPGQDVAEPRPAVPAVVPPVPFPPPAVPAEPVASAPAGPNDAPAGPSTAGAM